MWCAALIERPGGGYDGTADGEGAVACTIPGGVSQRSGLRGVFVGAALAGWFRLPRVRQGSRGGAEEPGLHLRMLELRSSDFAQAVVRAETPSLQQREDPMNPRQHDMSRHLADHAGQACGHLSQRIRLSLQSPLLPACLVRNSPRPDGAP